MGQPSPLKFLPELKRIQDQGNACFSASPMGGGNAMEVLSSKGLYLQVSASSKEEAAVVVRTVERMTHE